MSNYDKSNFAQKDALPSGSAGKIVSGVELDTEFGKIATAVNSKSNTDSPTFTGTVSVTSLSATGTITTANLTTTGTVSMTLDGGTY